MKITWIDDDIEIIAPVIEPLVEEGYEITQIRTVADALGSIDALRECDLILLDMIIPMGDFGEDFGDYAGATLLDRLRKEYGVVTPVIAFSVVERNSLEQRVGTLDVAGYVRKPALPTELQEKVNAVLRA